MDKKAYIDAMARAVMCASFGITDANEGNPYAKIPVTEQTLLGRIQQVEEYCKKAREAVARDRVS